MTTSNTPGPALGRNAIGQHVATAIMDHVAKTLLATWNPKRHAGITKDQALEAARQTFGYVPPAAWSYSTPHPVYGSRNVGRPAPKTAAPKTSARKTTARTTKTTPKTTPKTAPKTPVRKGAPKTATPATVARRVASKSTSSKGTVAA